MTYLYVFLLLILLGLIYMRFETTLLQVKHIRFTKNKKSLKVLQLSDIHINFLRVSTDKIRRAIDNEKPDFIIITGDFITKPYQIPEFMNFIREVKGASKIYLCLGNHDYGAFAKSKAGLEKFINDIASEGITVLHDRSEIYEKNSKLYNIIGFEDCRYSKHSIAETLSSLPDNVFANIAFSHNPDIILDIPKGAVDYLFCGHFHGGQIWAPFDIEFKLLRNERLCKMGVKRGLHKLNGTNLYINRGLGNVCFPLRFMSRPEITVFYIP